MFGAETGLTMSRSTTHEHLVSVIHTECERFTPGSLVRILDAGCGKGSLMDWLASELPRLRPNLIFEVYGFDVADHGVQGKNVSTNPRIRTISIKEPWPYPEEFFDVVISNQVLEHVAQPDDFFEEMKRTLKPNGFAAHQFPLKNYFLEGHIFLPFVHWIKNHDHMRSYICFLSRFGLGRFPDHHAATGVDLDEFSEQHADFMMFFTRYMSACEAMDLAHRHGLRGSFRYTREYYTRRFKKLLGSKKQKELYNRRRSALMELFSFLVFRHISGITLFLEKRNIYGHGTEERIANRLAEMKSVSAGTSRR